MIDTDKTAYLKANTILFAQKICQAIEEMTGHSFQLRSDTLKENIYTSEFNFNAYISFSGIIQGNYICSLDDSVAMKLINAYKDGMTKKEIREQRQEYTGLIKEVLNISVGQSIVELEKKFNDLTFFPSIVSFGEIEFPDIVSAKVDIEGRLGKIQCGFSINLATQKIGLKLEETLQELELVVGEAQKNMQRVLNLFPFGLAAIDKKGIILPGYSKSLVAISGSDPAVVLTGLSLGTVLSLSPEVADNMNNWIAMIFSNYNASSFEELSANKQFNEIKNSNNQVLNLRWFSVCGSDEKTLEKLLVVIEDITVKETIFTRVLP